MLSGAAIPAGAEAVDAVKTYARIVGGAEDALVAGLAASALALAERFTGQALIRRRFDEMVPRSVQWRRLGATPVAAILGIESVPVTGPPVALAAADFAVDIDAAGDGWVRVIDGGSDPATRSGQGRVRVIFEAGIAADWAALPETLRHGTVRLAAHFYASRDARGEPAAPPAAVTALWRPWRRMRIG